MPSVADILRQSGLSDEQIKTLDAKVVTGLETVVKQSQQQLDQAELARRANEELYTTQIAPALDKWGNEEANLKAQLAYYKAQAEGAKTAGFLPADAPFTPPGEQPRNVQGQYVAGGNAVPGSPGQADIQQLRTEVAGAFSDGMWAMQEYQRLNSKFLPDDVTVLAQESTRQRMPFRDFVAKKYDFEGRRAALAADERKKMEDGIRSEARAAVEKEYAERFGANPNLRVSEPSRFSQLERAVTAGERHNPLKMGREERRQATRRAIQSDIAQNATETVQ